MKIKANILKVTATESQGDEERTYSYEVWELPGGLIQEPGTTTQDSFYKDRDSIVVSHGAVTELEDTGVILLDVIDVIKSLAASYDDFGSGSVPEEAWGFIHEQLSPHSGML